MKRQKNRKIERITTYAAESVTVIYSEHRGWDHIVYVLKNGKRAGIDRFADYESAMMDFHHTCAHYYIDPSLRQQV